MAKTDKPKETEDTSKPDTASPPDAPAPASEQKAETAPTTEAPEQRRSRGFIPSRPVPNASHPDSEDGTNEALVGPQRPFYRFVDFRNPLSGPGQSRFVSVKQDIRTGEYLFPQWYVDAVEAKAAEEEGKEGS